MSVEPFGGVSLLAFAVLAKGFEHCDFAAFCERVVMPATRKQRCSLYDRWRREDGETGGPPRTKEVADVFVSYAWKYTVGAS